MKEEGETIEKKSNFIENIKNTVEQICNSGTLDQPI